MDDESVLELSGHDGLRVRESTIRSDSSLRISNGIQVLVLDDPKLWMIEIDGPIDRATAVFYDEQSGRPHGIRIESLGLCLADRMTEHGMELGKRRNEGLLWRSLGVRGVVFMPGGER